MKFQARHLLPLCLLLLVTTARCSCLTATTSSGTCEGTVGGVDVTGELDPESEYHTVYPTGSGETLTVLNLSCAKGKLKTRGSMRRVTALPSDPHSLPVDGGSTTCPPGTNDGGVPDAGTSDGGTSDAGTVGCTPGTGTGSGSTPVHDWELLSGLHPKLIAGVIEAIVKLDTSLDGTVTMEFEDGSKVTIHFNAYHEDSLDVGEPPSSGGGGGHSDFD
jgi:hypothetical protein